MTNTISIIRQAGFFADYAQLNENEFLSKLAEQHGFSLDQAQNPYDLLALDSKKFIDWDLESDVCPENKVYAELLQHFSSASNGRFLPTGIEETWASETGPARVSFISNGEKIVFEPEYLDDWIDGRVFDVINTEMQKNGNEIFYPCSGPDHEWFGQNIILIRLTPEEKLLLESKLQWKFGHGEDDMC